MTTSPVLSITDELLAEILLDCEDSELYQFGEYHVALPTARVVALVEHIRSLTERLEKADKDSERLDWMISNKATVQRYPHKGRPTFGVHRIEVGKYQRTEHASPREAIDAAIAQEGQSHE